MKSVAVLSIILIFLPGLLYAQQHMKIQVNQPENEISPYIYGQFSEHLGKGMYGGLWVGKDSDIPNTDGFRNDVISALKNLNVPDLRWPGGCFADEYNWRDGIGPQNERPTRVNTHWGMVTEPNAVGTHEFFRLAELLNTEPYLSANVGSETPEEMKNWIEYITYAGNSTLADMRRKNGRDKPWKLKFLGIGNESWGCGGNMTANFYADLYRRFATFAKNYSGNRLYKIASGNSDENYGWTDTLIKKAGRMMNAISLHYYTIPSGDWQHKGSSTDFGEKMYFKALQQSLRMKKIVEGHIARMDKYDPKKRVALAVDEWGIWTDPLPGTNPGFLRQQNSLRDAIIASTTLDIFNHHSDRIRMANIAQTVNVLQAMILTKGKKMIKTPTYYVFDFYKVHKGKQLLPMSFDTGTYSYDGKQIPGLSATTSKDSSGTVNVTMTNLDAQKARSVSITLDGESIQKIHNTRILTADKVNAINTFDQPEQVTPQTFSDYSTKNHQLTLQLPSKSIVVLQIN